MRCGKETAYSMKVVVLNGKGFMGFVLRHMFGIKKAELTE